MKSNIEGMGDNEKWNDFSVIKENNYLMLCYKGVPIPFQTSMFIQNDLEHTGYAEVQATINCIVKLENIK